jgi:hypothetical protein
MKNAVFWDVTPCDSYKIRTFGGMYRLLHQGDKNRRLRRALLLQITANLVPSSPFLVTLVMEVLRFSETSVLVRAT